MIRPSRRARPSLFSMPLLLGGICSASSSMAVITHLNGNVQAGSLPALSDSHTNVPIAALAGLAQSDTHGNTAQTDAWLTTPSGWFAGTTSAGSGGVGSASGSANADADMQYIITSSTLPPGTPVQISVAWAVAGRVSASGDHLGNINDVAQASLSGRTFVALNNVTVLSRSGGYSRRVTLFDGVQIVQSGTLNVLTDSASGNYDAAVGQSLRFLVESSAAAGTFAFNPALSRADVQFAVVWGASAITDGVEIRLAEDPAQPAPPSSSATPSQAAGLLPPSAACPCPADFDGSGGTPDSVDIDAFFAAWLTGDPAADTDCSGGTPDTIDIDAFFAAWLAGGC